MLKIFCCKNNSVECNDEYLRKKRIKLMLKKYNLDIEMYNDIKHTINEHVNYEYSLDHYISGFS